MARILGNSQEVFTFGELHFFDNFLRTQGHKHYLPVDSASRVFARLLTIQREGYFTRGINTKYIKEARSLLKKINLNSWTYLDIFSLFLLYECSRASKIIPCDHTPGNVHHIGLILNSYPSARIVNMIRDPRDVIFSQKRKWKRKFLGARNIPYREVFRSWSNYHPITISKLWLSAISAYEQYASHERVCSVRFEDLTANPVAVIKKVCSFLQIDFNPEMLDVPHKGSSHRADSPNKKGLNSSAIGKWRQGGLNKAEIYLCQMITKRKMLQYSYIPEKINPTPLVILAYLLILFPKAAISLCLNLQRKSKLINLIKNLKSTSCQLS